MSVSQYSITDAKVAFVADNIPIVPSSYSGQLIAGLAGPGTMAFGFNTGTVSFWLYAYNANRTYKVWVDGVDKTAASSAAGNISNGVYTKVTISGLTDGVVHQLQLLPGDSNCLIGNTGNIGIELTGAAPALSTCANGSLVYRFADIKGTNCRVDGLCGQGSDGQWTVQAAYTGGMIEVSVSGQVAIVVKNGHSINVRTDGDQWVQYTCNSALGLGYDLVMLPNPSVGGTHRYQIIHGTYSLQSYVWGIVVQSGGSLDTISTWPARVSFGALGDSITYGMYEPTPNSWIRQLADATDTSMYALGFPGDTTAQINAAGSASMIAANPSSVFVMAGTNDGGTSAQFIIDYTSLANTLCAGLPSSTIFFLSVIPTNSQNWAYQEAHKNGYIRQILAGLAYKNWQFIDLNAVYPNFNPVVNQDTNDGIHPNKLGGLKIATGTLRKALIPSVPGYVLPGTASGSGTTGTTASIDSHLI
jgi:lysophospholipase L1-like esterase